MNNSLWIEIIFWTALFIVFYTYLGYGIVLCLLVKLKELFVKPVRRVLPAADRDLPEVTLFITAFNEADIVDEKMANSLELDYPEEKLHIVWVTDGSDDGTNERLRTPLGRESHRLLPTRTAGKNRRHEPGDETGGYPYRRVHRRQHDGEPAGGPRNRARL